METIGILGNKKAFGQNGREGNICKQNHVLSCANVQTKAYMQIRFACELPKLHY